MRVEDQIIKCAVFLGVQGDGRFSPIGTASIGAVKVDEFHFNFLITARHLLDDYPTANLCVRVNLADGKGSHIIPIEKRNFCYANPAVDVALVPISLHHGPYDVTMLQLDRAYWDGARKTLYSPHAGDEIVVVGLYTSHHGLRRNLPVVRVGHIAAMPSEPVFTSRGEAEAYLVELQSIAGLSGSPVFLNVPPVAIIDRQLRHLNEPVYLPLGIQIGYHLFTSKEDAMLVPLQQGDEPPDEDKASGSMDERRTGFSVVIPIEVVFDMVESEHMQAIMRRSAAEHRAEAAARAQGPTASA